MNNKIIQNRMNKENLDHKNSIYLSLETTYTSKTDEIMVTLQIYIFASIYRDEPVHQNVV